MSSTLTALPKFRQRSFNSHYWKLFLTCEVDPELSTCKACALPPELLHLPNVNVLPSMKVISNFAEEISLPFPSVAQHTWEGVSSLKWGRKQQQQWLATVGLWPHLFTPFWRGISLLLCLSSVRGKKLHFICSLRTNTHVLISLNNKQNCLPPSPLLPHQHSLLCFES